MKEKGKKLLALVLAMTMCLSVFSTGIWAADLSEASYFEAASGETASEEGEASAVEEASPEGEASAEEEASPEGEASAEEEASPKGEVSAEEEASPESEASAEEATEEGTASSGEEEAVKEAAEENAPAAEFIPEPDSDGETGVPHWFKTPGWTEIDSERLTVMAGEEAAACSNVRQAGEYLRSRMMARDALVTIHYTGAVTDTLKDEIFDKAVEHNGVPNEGDYLRIHVAQRGFDTRADGSAHTLTFSFTYNTTSEEEAETDRRVASVLAELNLNGTSEYDRVRKIYDFITSHVSYDYDSFEGIGDNVNQKNTTYSALVRGKATCAGFAVTLYRLLLEVGVDSRVILGYAGGYHGWNILRIGDVYYETDSTWDVGENGNYSYFLKRVMVDHQRDKQYSTDEFNARYPMARQDYFPPVVPTDNSCGKNLTWAWSEPGILTISGTGNMTNFSGVDAVPWRDYRSSIFEVVVENGVTSLGAYALSGCENLTRVQLSSGLRYVGEFAFFDCSSLCTVLLPASAATICPGAFSGCTALEEITIPSGVSVIYSQTFLNCKSLAKVDFPASVSDLRVDGCAFQGCDSLQHITLPDGTSSLKNNAFYQCTGLTEINLPDSVNAVGKYAFAQCSSLKRASFGTGITAVSKSVFENCADLEQVEFRGAVTEIGSQAFCNCTSLTGVRGLSKVQTVGESAFWGCSSLTGMDALSQARTIGSSAFSGCTSLSSVALGTQVTSIGSSAFFRCSKLSRLDGSLENVINLGEHAFRDCSSLRGPLKLGAVPEICYAAFYHCSSLTGVELADSVTAIDEFAFAQCGKLTSVQGLSKLRTVGSNAFSGCTSLSSVDLGTQVTDIGSSAFSGCTSLSSVALGTQVTSIGSGAFYGCSKLSKLNGSLENVINLGEHAFRDCSSLKGTVTLSVPTVSYAAFYNCARLTGVELTDQVTSIDDFAFGGCKKLKQLTIRREVEKIGAFAFAKETELRGYLNSAADRYAMEHEHRFAALDKGNNTISVKKVFTKTPNRRKAQRFKLNASANGAPLSYKSGSKKVKVNNSGTVTIAKGFLGKATITISAADNGRYYAARTSVTVNVVPGVTRITGVTAAHKGVVTLKWKKIAAGKGYQVQYSTDSSFKEGVKTINMKKSNTVSARISGLTANKLYYFRIRTVDGKHRSDWSGVKSTMAIQ